FVSSAATLRVTPEADSRPLEIGGVDYRPATLGAFLPEADLPKIKTIFWHNNIIALAPVLEVEAQVSRASQNASPASPHRAVVMGTWADHSLPLKDGSEFVTGIAKTNPWWKTEGGWFSDHASECVVGTRLAEENGVKAGDTVNVSADGRSWMALQVSGVLTSGGPEDDAVIVPLRIAQKLAGRAGQY